MKMESLLLHNPIDLDAEARQCTNGNAAALLMEIALWFYGQTLFDEDESLHETADRLFGGANGDADKA